MHTLVGVVFALLKQHFQSNFHIGHAAVIYEWDGSPTTVWRYAIQSDDPNIPTSVILKRSNIKHGTLFQDAAGLRFLNNIPALNGLFPQLYGVDYQQELLVMEDLLLPPEALVGNILFETDREVAAKALCELGRALAHLHIATRERQADYEAITASFKKITPSRHRVHRLLMCIAEFPTAIERLGIFVPRTVYDDLKLVAKIIREPGDFLAFTHGDGTPANAFYDGEHIKLFDLEASGFRHILLDGTFARLRYIYSVWAREFPLEIQRAMFTAYREALADGFTLAADDSVFLPHYVGCCAAWLAAIAISLPDATKHDHTWGRSTWRQRIVAAFEHFAFLSAETGQFVALGELSQAVAKHLWTVWDARECQMQGYPAFA